MRIYIIRHGESQATLDPSLFSKTDPMTIPLSQWGYHQARHAGTVLRERYTQDEAFQGRKLHVYYSPHLRIVQSKDAIIKGLGAHHVSGSEVDDRLREREHGEFDRLTPEQQEARDPDAYAMLHAPDYFTRYTTPMPGGESLKDVDLRLQSFVASLKERLRDDEDVVIVTHGGNCKGLEDMLLHPNASWICDHEHVPGTGDIIEIDTESEPPTASVMHEGKKRLDTQFPVATRPYTESSLAR